MHSFLLTLIRHGETEENVCGIIQGQADTRLNDTGLEQAYALAHNFPIDQYDLVFSSDLARAYDTCAVLFEYSQRNSDVIIKDKRLRERYFASLQGASVKYLFRLAAAAEIPVPEYTPPGGETPEQSRARAVDFLKNGLFPKVAELQASLEPQDDNKEVCALVVSHGGLIREIITYLKSFNQAAFVKLMVGPNDPDPSRIPPNTSVSTFKISFEQTTENGEKIPKIRHVECTKLHDISHLNPKLRKKALRQKQVNDVNGPGA